MTGKKVNAVENNEQTGDVNGMFGREKIEEIPNYNASSDEKVINNGNAWITLGRDRPVGFSSGYGGAGNSRSAAIDLCVGRQGVNPDSNNFVENNFGTLSYNKKPGDAARIYISQRADIDEYFGLSEGSQGLSRAKAAIGMMADDIRIVARRGIKLVTGGPKQTDALGNETNSQLGIDLIAGNVDIVDLQGKEYLQPMVKGQNLVEALTQIVEEIASLNGIVTNFMLNQMVINKSLTSGPYVGVGNLGAPIVTFLNPASMSVAMAQNNIKMISDGIVPLSTQRNVVINSLKIDYLQSSGQDYICSRYNRTN